MPESVFEEWRSRISQMNSARSGPSQPALMLELLLPDADLVARVRADQEALAAVAEGLGITDDDLYGRHLLLMVEKLIRVEMRPEGRRIARGLTVEQTATAREIYLERFRERMLTEVDDVIS